MAALLKKEKPKKLKIIFEKAKNLTPDQKKGILASKARVLGLSRPPAPKVSLMPEVLELPRSTATIIQKSEATSRDVAGSDIEAALRKGLDDVYAKKGIMGLGKVSGIESKEWDLMKKLSAEAVLGYYSGDSSASLLSPNITTALAKSEEHYRLVGEVRELMGQIKGGVKPYQNENVEAFLKRLITLALKSN